MIKILGQYLSLRKTAFILGEGILICCAALFASYSLMYRETYLALLIENNWWKLLLFTVVTQASLYFSDLYEMRVDVNRIELATQLIQAIGITSVILGLIYFLWPEAMIGRWIFFLTMIILVLFIVHWRLLYSFVVHKKFFSEKALIVGDGELARALLQEINSQSDPSYEIRCVVGQENGRYGQDKFMGRPLKYGFESLCELAEAENISNIIVALDQSRGVMPHKELLSCKLSGINVIDGHSFYERITGKLLVERINPSWLIFSNGFRKPPVVRLIKRTAGFFFALFLGAVLFPLFLVVAAAIKLDSKGPVLFRQKRVGEKGRIYTLYKFRSMREDAEEDSGPVWTEEHDPRITRAGRVIRKLRIDELPQIINVIKGDMSFVGPRPERPFFVDTLKKKFPFYGERHTVKPGITGWAQVMYGYGGSEEDALEKLKYDLYYIKNMSLLMDLVVVFHTLKIVLLGRGSR